MLSLSFRSSGAGTNNSPLEDVAAALTEQFERSAWNVEAGSAQDWPFMLAVMRSCIVAWQSPGDTLQQRLDLGEALASAFGLAEDTSEQARHHLVPAGPMHALAVFRCS